MNLALMNMAKRPVIIALQDQIIDRARCINIMSFSAGKTGVEDANVDGALNRWL